MYPDPFPFALYFFTKKFFLRKGARVTIFSGVIEGEMAGEGKQN